MKKKKRKKKKIEKCYVHNVFYNIFTTNPSSRLLLTIIDSKKIITIVGFKL